MKNVLLVIFSVVFMGEQVSWRQWLGASLGLESHHKPIAELLCVCMLQCQSIRRMRFTSAIVHGS